MRAVVPLLLLAVTSCGRVWFDALEDAGAGARDSDAQDASVGLPPGSVEVPLAPAGSCTTIAWSGDSAGVAWLEPDGGGDALTFARLDDAGVIVQGPVVVAAALQFAMCPSIAWTGQGFLIAIAHGGTRRDIGVVHVSSSGPGVLADVVSTPGGSEVPSLALLGAQVALVWQEASGSNYAFEVQPLTPAGAADGSAVQVAALGGVGVSPTLVATAAGFVVLWVQGARIQLQQLDAGALPVGLPATVDGLGAASVFTAAAWTGGDLVIAAPGGVTSLMTGRADLGGSATAGPHVTGDDNIYLADLAWTGTGATLLYLERTGTSSLHLADLDASASVVSDLVVRDVSSSRRVAIAWTGSGYLIAGDDDLDGAYVLVIPRP